MTGQVSFQEAMDFMKFDITPSMKELNTKYRRMALIKHPDKNGGSVEAKEDYQMLLNCYKVIGDFLVNEANEKANDEEKDNINLFRNFG